MRNVHLLPWTVAASAWALAQLGEMSEALNRLREGLELRKAHEAQGIKGNRGWLDYCLARASLLVGGLDEASTRAEGIVAYSSSHRGWAAHALHVLGDVAAHPDRFEPMDGEAYYREALALAEPRGMRPLVAHCHFGLGRLYRRTGKLQDSIEHLTAATTMYREMDMRFWLEQAETFLRE
jgi:tetratricopeptide (TPR) repeat protein